MHVADAEPGGLEAKCRRESSRRCLQAKAYPDEPLHWELEVTLCRGSACDPGVPAVLDELIANGGYESWSGRGRSITVTMSYDDVTAVARLDEVVAITVTCGDSAFCSCADLPAERCDEHAFCWQISGWAFDETCVSDRKRPLGCSGEQVCESSETDMIAPDGRRWRLPSSCKPAVPGWERARDDSSLARCNGS